MKVSELVEELKELYPKFAPSTYLYWQKSIKPIADLDTQEVTKATARKYRVQSLQSMSENTVLRRIAYLKSIWTKGLYWELLSGTNPWQHAADGLIKKDREPEYHPWEFYEPYHEHPWFRILWYTGARIAEVAALDPKNIVMNASIPYVNFVNQPNRKLKNPSSKRKVPLHPSTWDYIEDFKPTKMTYNHGHRWSYDFGQRLGLPHGIAAHTLRHSFTTMCRDQGVEEYFIDIFTGHAKQSVTSRYGRTHFKILKDIVYKFEHH
tara:strand:+ start:8615 stop:9406 length:792 start_codon:yes stop_codon:yes gene_type:complete